MLPRLQPSLVRCDVLFVTCPDLVCIKHGTPVPEKDLAAISGVAVAATGAVPPTLILSSDSAVTSAHACVGIIDTAMASDVNVAGNRAMRRR
eukprot:363740-Chlamydomonas_euryale.AAC.30